MSLEITRGTIEDLPECARLIAVAFEDDPVVREMVPGDENRLARLTRFFESELRAGPLVAGALDVVRLEAGGPIAGAGAWVGPEKPSSWVQLRELPNLLRAIGLRHVAASVAALRAFDGPHPEFPHWYLSDIVVSPDARGRGIGGALLEHRLALIDDEALPAYLEATTDGSRRLYERFGFEATGTFDVGSAPATSMLRPAART